MNLPQSYRPRCAVLLAVWALGPAVAAAPPGNPGSSSRANPAPPPQIADVELGDGGLLRGVVVDIQAVPVSNVQVVVRQLDRQVAAAKSDPMGRFAVERIRGGTYEVAVGNHSGFVRAWAHETAPPSAKPLALVVVGDDVVRGQLMRLHLGRHLVTGAIVGAIATPIILNNIDKDKSVPVSP